jgi:hypothetical protein
MMSPSTPAPTHSKPARILVASMRNFNDDASSCSLYEFEDCIKDLADTDIFAPVSDYTSLRKLYRTIKYISRSDTLAAKLTPYPTEFVIDQEYDLLLVVVNAAWDLHTISLIQKWREKCRYTACYVAEIFEPDLKDWRMMQEPFRNFDHIFVSNQYCSMHLGQIIDRPVTHLPFGLDTLKFCPYPNPPQRSIDVCSFGRRAPHIHDQLFKHAQNSNFFYYYDTTKKLSLKIDNPTEHRMKFTSLLKRSRYTINYFAKFDEVDIIGRSQEMGPRFFEGAAAGTVMIGMAPAGKTFNEYFDWEDVVIEIDPKNGNIMEVIADLEAQPTRLAQISRNNIVNCLLKHDWVYRWQKMLAVFNLEPHPAVFDREQQLKQLAQDITMLPLGD